MPSLLLFREILIYMKKIKEEIGRNYHTLDTDPYTWKDYSDVAVETYANAEDSTWSAKVNCISNPKLSSPERRFSDEQSANHWARMQAERIMRKTLNEFRNIIKEIIIKEFVNK